MRRTSALRLDPGRVPGGIQISEPERAEGEFRPITITRAASSSRAGLIGVFSRVSRSR